MTNSRSSTDGARRGPGARSIALAVGLGLLGAFALLALPKYGWRPTVGTGFLALGWMSIVATAWFLLRAAQAFDLTVVSAPLLEEDLDDRRREELELEKRHLLKAIKEVEFDHATGKVDDADAVAMIGRYRSRALEILRALDEGKPTDYRALVEKELVRRIARAGGVKAPAAKAAKAAPVPAAEAAGGTPAPRVCAACDLPNDGDAVFCKKCGGRLDGGAAG
jgi:hypothetical protein